MSNNTKSLRVLRFTIKA